MLGRTLYDITLLLESADGADERVRRVLERLRALVPYDRCALLEMRLGDKPRFLVVPETVPDERLSLSETLLGILGKLVDHKSRAGTLTQRPEGVHLAVPLVALDEVVGLLFVRSAAAAYTEEHVRALSVVAAKLAGYLTMLRATAELGELTRERDDARRAAEVATRVKDDFVTVVSDKLRSPLTSLLGCAHLLRSTSANAAERARALDELEGNVQTQLALIAESASSPPGQSAQDRLLAGIRVLLIDHDLEARESFQSVLEDYGVDVITAASAPEAMAVLAAKQSGARKKLGG